MIGPIDLAGLDGPDAEMWAVLLELAQAFPQGWAVVGAQMVILHCLAHDVERPVRTRDTDVVVDLRTLHTRQISRSLLNRGFELAGITPEGVGHRFVRGGAFIDVLAIDNLGIRGNPVTVPPARTVQVPGSRSALQRIERARVTVNSRSGEVPLPDWIGALLLKARAARAFREHREKHLQDIALLLGLPVDVATLRKSAGRSELKYILTAADLINDDVWTAVKSSIDPQVGRAAIALLGAR